MARDRTISIEHSAVLEKWRFTSILSKAMTMSAAVAQFLKFSGKMRYEAPLYVRLHRTLYSMYGKTAGYAEFLP